MVLITACVSRIYPRTLETGAFGYLLEVVLSLMSLPRPNMDQLSLSESLLCMGNDAINFLADYHNSRSQVCTNSCNLVSRRDTSTSDFWRDGFAGLETIDNVGSTPLEKAALLSRNLGDSEHVSNTGPDGEPSWGQYLFFESESMLNFFS